MKTQLTTFCVVSCLSEFDPALILVINMIVNEHYNELRSDYVVKISAGFNSRN